MEAGTTKNGIIIVQPICLPPPGPITFEESSEDETKLVFINGINY